MNDSETQLIAVVCSLLADGDLKGKELARKLRERGMSFGKSDLNSVLYPLARKVPGLSVEGGVWHLEPDASPKTAIATMTTTPSTGDRPRSNEPPGSLNRAPTTAIAKPKAAGATIHVSARVSWHDDGWNGRVCRNPAANTFCVGSHSYPGNLIAQKRLLEWESREDVAGQPCGRLKDGVPPCCFSVNAFGTDDVPAESEPPIWWRDGTETRRWTLPPATVCVWPYEQMYGDDVKTQKDTFDYDVRLANAREYFEAIERDKSLIVYYANYSNPFSEDDARRYVLVGLSRVKSVGEELFFEGTSENIRKRYGGGFVWQRAITSHYPDEGVRLPYHLYRDRPDELDRFALFPENPRLFKFATRHMFDDDALGIVEGFLRSVRELEAMGDTSENWRPRINWLEGLVSQLWRNRGLLPGLPSVLETLGFHDAISSFRSLALAGRERDASDQIWALVTGSADQAADISVDGEALKTTRRQWRLRAPSEQALLRNILPRFALSKEQVENLLSDKRHENGIYSDLASIHENPYRLSEEYVGDNVDDVISWSVIDRGMIPSPELGGVAIAADDGRRFRGLLVDVLRREDSHVFTPTAAVLDAVNKRLSALPEWKRFSFNERYLAADRELIEEAIEFRAHSGQEFLYLRSVFEDERLIEKTLRFLVGGPDIELRTPVTAATWKGYLYDANSMLARKAPDEYLAAIERQIAACQRVFVRPVSVLAGEAGTGKTTVIRALVKAIKRGHGTGTSVVALAPTGKAADRIREVMEKDEALRGHVDVSTLHSFLAQRQWINENRSFRRDGGVVEENYSTYILDESSMLDLDLTATFVRSVKWASVQRLILVGDPNQLPPIGRGRVFADIIEHLQQHAPESVATLEHNLRQLLGRITGGGTGIIDLAKCYLHGRSEGPKSEDQSSAAEVMLQLAQQGGEVAPDLRVEYWRDQKELNELLIGRITGDLAADVSRLPKEPSSKPTGEDSASLRDLWWRAHDGHKRPSYLQILTPYRGEFYGVDELNRVMQSNVRGAGPTSTNHLDGIMLFDKVIQIRNRPKSDPISAWNHTTRANESIQIYNGQLGFTWPHLFDKDTWKGKRLERFRVCFERCDGFSVGYGRDLGTDKKGRSKNEKVELNLELAYAISVHKAQGSEFERTYIVVPSSKSTLLTSEMFYTAVTRATRHCTLLVERDISSLVGMRRAEASRLRRINSSLFEMHVVPAELLALSGWYPDGRIHHTLAEALVRSKSEVIIANLLHEREIAFKYEQPLFASDGSFYLPDFTVTWRGTDYYWEHLGMLERDDYRAHWEKKKKWYEKYFPGRLILSHEAPDLSKQADEIIRTRFK